MNPELTPKERKLLDRDDRATGRVGLWLSMIAISFLGSMAVVGWQILEWLKVGEWRTVPISIILARAGIDPIQVSWIGVQKVIDRLSDLPLSALLFVTGIVFMFVSTWKDGVAESEALKIARTKRARQSPS